jgi:hypothetical protein
VVLSRTWVDNINRIALLLGFLSFWFAAPEFIGEERLKLWEHSLASGLRRVPLVMAYTLLGLCVIAFVILAVNAVGNGGVALSVWTVAGLFLSLVAVLLVRDAIERIVSRLANDDRTRQNSLFVGAVLFTASFLLQLIATF